MRDRLRTIFIALVATTATVAAPLAAHGSVAPPKVVIIVGPTGSYTDSYRSQGDDIAAAASADGANVVKVYSPNATWSQVRAAVAGAKIIVYLGHGNGYPNPYGSTFLPDRTDGWGLNRIAGVDSHDPTGDGDDWSLNMVYCGEKALLGTLTSSDGSAQRSYCGGNTNTDGIAPAAGFVMVYSNACYAPGANEPQNPDATATVALKHVSYYSRPVLAGLGASGYFATDHGAATLVSAILSSPDTSYGNLYLDNLPNGDPLDYPHYLLSGTRAWLTHTSDYTYAFAGNPGRTFNGGTAPYASPPSASSLPSVTGFAPAPGATGVGMTPSVRVTFSEPVSNVSSSTVVLWDAVTWKVVGATVALDSSATVATLRPKNPLQPKHRYAVRVSSWIVDADNNQLTYASMLFTTTLTQSYSPARSLTFTAGPHTGYKFSSTGAILATRAYTLARPSGAPTSKRSGITGRSGGWYYVTAGVWAGYWIKEGSGITLQ